MTVCYREVKQLLILLKKAIINNNYSEAAIVAQELDAVVRGSYQNNVIKQ